MKKIIITLLVCTSSLLAKAQLGYNYAQYDLGFAGALNRAYTDAETVTNTPGAFISFTYNQTPYLNFIAEAQAGQLKGGDVFTTLSSRYFNNHYKAVSFRVQLQAGELFDYSQSRVFNALKNFYGSTGLGVVYNSMHEINRTSLYIEDFTAPGVNTSSEVFIPVKVGYEFKIFNSYNEPTVKFDLGYQANFDLGDQLDGMKAGSRRDIFTQFTIGFKFALGGYTSYRKQIQY